MPATYPTSSDLQQYLAGAGIIDAKGATLPLTLVDYAQAVASAQSNYEGRIGRKLLAASATRTFDPPQYPSTALQLKGDMAGNPTSVTVAGTAMVLNTDYFMLPANANNENPSRPFTILDFANPQTCTRQQISITGLWGYAATISDGAWNAIQARAAYICHPQIAMALTRGMLVWKDDVVTEQYGPDPLGFLRNQWESIYEGGVERFLSVSGYFGG